MAKEKEFTPELKCEHCNNMAPMEVVARHSQMRVVDERSGYEAGRVYELIKCPACAEVTLCRYYWADHMDPSEVQSITLYPTQTNMPTGLPEQIARAHEAALRVRNVDANAYGVLIGRLLEMICEDRQAKGDTLAAKLSNLSAKGEIPEKLVGVAGNLRGFRNVGAHAGLGELTKAEVPILDSLCKAILEYIYGAPYLVQQATDRLEQLKAAKKSRERASRSKK